MTTYTILSAPFLNNPADQGCLVGIYGQVNSVYVFFEVFKSALDEAANQAGIETYLGPLMLATSTAFYASAGSNPTANSLTAIPYSATAQQYPNMPSSWTV